jgi:hypothetical protein
MTSIPDALVELARPRSRIIAITYATDAFGLSDRQASWVEAQPCLALALRTGSHDHSPHDFELEPSPATSGHDGCGNPRLGGRALASG